MYIGECVALILSYHYQRRMNQSLSKKKSIRAWRALFLFISRLEVYDKKYMIESVRILQLFIISFFQNRPEPKPPIYRHHI